MSDLGDALEDGHDLMAAEYALGVLDADGWRAAERRLESDVAFSAEVQWWTAKLSTLAAPVTPVAAPGPLWDEIERRLDQPTRRAAASTVVVDLGLRRQVRTWRAIAAGASTLAAVFLAALVWPRPRPVAPAPVQVAVVQKPVILIARLTTKHGGADFVVTLEQTGSRLIVTPASISAEPHRSPELWLLPTGGKPTALGLVSFDRSVRIADVAGRAGLGRDGRVALAVSLEPLGGSPTGQPTGPVVATGALEKT